MAPPKRPWFRYYVETLHDRKLRTRPPAQRVLWDALMCMAASSPERGTLLIAEGVPADEIVIADEAALPIKDVREGLTYFEKVSMIYRNDIDAWVVKSFLERQYESDVSTDRTAKHRSNAVASDTDEASQERSPSVSVSSASVSPSKSDEDFERFYAAYPLHVARVAARKAFDGALKKAPADEIVAGAERFAADPNRDQTYTPHPASWLNQGRWDDDPLPSRSSAPQREPVGNRNTERIRRITEEVAGISTLGHIAQLEGGAA